MALSPLDIHNKEFGRSMFRGYDEDDVNEFLEQVLKDYENILEENKVLKADLKQSKEQISHYNTIEETLHSSILTAQEAAEDVRRNSKKESQLIVKEAERNADRIVNEALSRAREIAIEVDDLKKQSKVFRSRFRMLLEAQLELMQADEWDKLVESEIGSEQMEFTTKE